MPTLTRRRELCPTTPVIPGWAFFRFWAVSVRAVIAIGPIGWDAGVRPSGDAREVDDARFGTDRTDFGEFSTEFALYPSIRPSRPRAGFLQ